MRLKLVVIRNCEWSARAIPPIVCCMIYTAATLSTRRVTFYSRSRDELWTKGETSGQFLDFVDATLDCDRDAVLIAARPHGPTCHLDTTSCFGAATAPGIGFLPYLASVVAKRDVERPEGSYTTTLLEKGLSAHTRHHEIR